MNDFIPSITTSIINFIFWSLAYIFIIIITKKTKVNGIPLWALAFNIVWELLYGIAELKYWIQNPNETIILSMIITITNFVWFSLDCIILYQYFKYAKRLWTTDSRKYFVPYIILSLFICALVNVGIFMEFSNQYSNSSRPESTYESAFLDNVMISVCFLYFAFQNEKIYGQSLWIGLFKMIGTLIPSIMFGIVLAPNYFSYIVVFCGTASLILDILYCVFLAKNQKTTYGRLLNWTHFEKIPNRR